MKKNSRYEEPSFIDILDSLDDSNISFKKIENLNLDESSSGYRIEDSIISNCTFTGNIKEITFYNVKFINCDFSTCTFYNIRIDKSLITECRCTGTNIFDSKINNTDFINNQMAYINFNSNFINDTKFKNNNLNKSSFDNINFKDLELIDNDLSFSEIYNTNMNEVDITSNKIDGISLSPEMVKGMIVDEIQAITLIGILGIKIK